MLCEDRRKESSGGLLLPVQLDLAISVWAEPGQDLASDGFRMFAAFILAADHPWFEIWTLGTHDYATTRPAQGGGPRSPRWATGAILWPLLPQGLGAALAGGAARVNDELSRKIRSADTEVDALTTRDQNGCAPKR